MFSYDINQPTTWAMRGKVFALTCICIALIIGWAYCAYLHELEHEIIIHNDAFQVRAFFYGTHVNFSDIIEISLLNQNLIEIGGMGRRVVAGVVKNRAKGNFQKGFFYAYITDSPTIHITRRNAKPIYINFRSDTKTGQIYSLLKGAFLQFKEAEL